MAAAVPSATPCLEVDGTNPIVDHFDPDDCTAVIKRACATMTVIEFRSPPRLAEQLGCYRFDPPGLASGWKPAVQ
jgi:hypothetical protein